MAPTTEAAVDVAAEIVVDRLRGAIEARGRAGWVLAGGSTPRPLHRRLATMVDALDWRLVDVYWGDERLVPYADPHSNFGNARRDLLDPLEIDPHRRFPIAVEPSAAAAADAYEPIVAAALAHGPFDVVSLGVGADGHTASIFEPEPASGADGRLVRATHAPVAPHPRVTLTTAALTRARCVLFLACGPSKAEVIGRVLDGDDRLPAAGIAGDEATIWCLDAAAAASCRRAEAG